jgi:hypothetical protein
MMNGDLKPDWQFKKALREAGVTLKALERFTEINHAFLSMYSNGRYNLNQTEKRRIARALDMPERKIFSTQQGR